MKAGQTKIIFGAAISAATIAIAIDHSRQRLPEPEKTLSSQQAVIILEEGDELPVESNTDCSKTTTSGRRAAPCSL